MLREGTSLLYDYTLLHVSFPIFSYVYSVEKAEAVERNKFGKNPSS